MARIRTIKPGFFLNEDLAALPPILRLLYVGLWTQADREGRLEDRPARLKVALLPYDDVDVDEGLGRLEAARLIVRYEADGRRYIAIPTWHKHQQPHVKEALSLIPAPAPCSHPLSTVLEPDQHVRKGREGKGTGREGEGADAPPAADGAADLMGLWNERIQAPIPRCRELSSTRRRAARVRLNERPLTEWSEVFTRIQASSFCRGGNDRGWVATFDWAIGSPDVAVKVLEGKYDDRRKERPFTDAERRHAEQVRKSVGRCQHDPLCASYAACVETIMRAIRTTAGAA